MGGRRHACAVFTCVLATPRAGGEYTEWAQVSSISDNVMTNCPLAGRQHPNPLPAPRQRITPPLHAGENAWYNNIDLCECKTRCERNPACNTINYRSGQCQFYSCSLCSPLSCQLENAFGWTVYTSLRQPFCLKIL